MGNFTAVSPQENSDLSAIDCRIDGLSFSHKSGPSSVLSDAIFRFIVVWWYKCSKCQATETNCDNFIVTLQIKSENASEIINVIYDTTELPITITRINFVLICQNYARTNYINFGWCARNTSQLAPTEISKSCNY